jgi:hypothetical protein
MHGMRTKTGRGSKQMMVRSAARPANMGRSSSLGRSHDAA